MLNSRIQGWESFMAAGIAVEFSDLFSPKCCFFGELVGLTVASAYTFVDVNAGKEQEEKGRETSAQVEQDFQRE